MPSRIRIGPDGGPYVIVEEDNGDVNISSPNGNVDFQTDDISNVGALTADSVSTDEILGVADAIFVGGESVTEINSALSTAGSTVVLSGDHSGLSDRIEVTAADVTLVIQPDATVKIANGATPTTITGNQGGTYTPAIYATGVNGVDLRVRGTVDANDTNHAGGAAFFIKSSAKPAVDFAGGNIVDANDGGWIVDCEEPTVKNVTSDSTSGAVVVAEGGSGGNIAHIHSDGGDETVDLNAFSSGFTVEDITGENLAGQVVDVNESPNTTVRGVKALGTNCSSLVEATGNAGSRHTDETAPGNCDDLTVIDPEGVVTDDAIKFTTAASRSNTLQNATVSGARVRSTGGQAFAARPQGNNEMDGIELSGRFTTDASVRCVELDGEAGQCSGAEVYLNIQSPADDGFVTIDWDDVTGNVRVSNAGAGGIQAFEVNGQCDGWRLSVNVQSCTGSNISLQGSDQYVSGITKDSAVTDLVFNGSNQHFDGIAPTTDTSGATNPTVEG